MAITRKQKGQLLQEYSDRLARAQVAVWSEYRGLDVSQMTVLRRRMREVGAETVVVRNTLMRRALEEAGMPTEGEFMTGTNAVAFLYDDIAPGAKALRDFAEANERLFRIKGGIAGGRLIEADQVRSLATIPSREELLGKVVGGMQAPISGLVFTLAGMLRGLVNVLNARSGQLEGSTN